MVKQHLSDGDAPTQFCACRSQTLRFCSCTNHEAACVCHTLALLSVGRLHNGNNNALVDSMQTPELCAGASVNAPKDSSSIFIFRPRRSAAFCETLRVGLVSLVKTRCGGGQALHSPASGCIADLSSCTVHRTLLCTKLEGSFCAESSSVDFQKKELGTAGLKNAGRGLAVRARQGAWMALPHFRNWPGGASGSRSGGGLAAMHPSATELCRFLPPLPIAVESRDSQTSVRFYCRYAAGTARPQDVEQIRLWDLLHMHAGRKERRQELVVPNHAHRCVFHPRFAPSLLRARDASPPRPGIDGE